MYLRYLLLLSYRDQLSDTYTYIDLFRTNLLTDLLTESLMNRKNFNNFIKKILDELFENISENKHISFIDDLKNLNININIKDKDEDEYIRKKYPNIDDHEIKTIDIIDLDYIYETRIKNEDLDINLKNFLICHCKTDNIKYYIDLKKKDSLIRKILDKDVYSKNLKEENQTFKINEIINNIYSTNFKFSNCILKDENYISSNEIIFNYKSKTYENDINTFTNFLNEYNEKNVSDNQLGIFNNDTFIILTFKKKINFSSQIYIAVRNGSDKYPENKKKYLQYFILFYKDFWSYEITGDKITKDEFFDKIFNEKTDNLFINNPTITLTLLKDKITNRKIDFNKINEIKISKENNNNINYLIKQIIINNKQASCYFTILIGNDKYKINFQKIENEIIEAYQKIDAYQKILNFDFFNNLIKSKFNINMDLRFIHLLYIPTDEVDNFLFHFKDIGTRGGNKYTLKELKQIAKKNKIKITKMIIISNEELHKKLKDKNININKKIKLEDFKRILMENNIKITKRVNLNKQELIKKLIN